MDRETFIYGIKSSAELLQTANDDYKKTGDITQLKRMIALCHDIEKFTKWLKDMCR